LIQQQWAGYIYAVFDSPFGGADDVEFLLSTAEDSTVSAHV
jgi:hypothetical protein